MVLLSPIHGFFCVNIRKTLVYCTRCQVWGGVSQPDHKGANNTNTGKRNTNAIQHLFVCVCVYRWLHSPEGTPSLRWSCGPSRRPLDPPPAAPPSSPRLQGEQRGSPSSCSTEHAPPSTRPHPLSFCSVQMSVRKVTQPHTYRFPSESSHYNYFKCIYKLLY